MITNEVTTLDIFNNWIHTSSSKHTGDRYSNVINQFLRLVFKKGVEDLLEEDLNNLKPIDIDIRYKNYLLEKGFKQSTLINNFTIINGFMHQLDINGIFPKVNYAWIKEVAFNKRGLKDDSETRKNMNHTDYIKMIDWLENDRFSGRFKDKGIKYSLALQFMWTTAARIDATFNVEWENFYYEEDGNGNLGWNIYVNDKGGKINVKPISDEFYQKLFLVFGNQDGLVFKGLSKRSFTDLMSEFCKIYGKEFTPHSVKRGAVTHLYSLTKDLVTVQRFADHEDPKTTIRYIQENTDRTSQGSYILSTSYDESVIDNLTNEELVKIIKGRRDLMFGVIQEFKKMIIQE